MHADRASTADDPDRSAPSVQRSILDHLIRQGRISLAVNLALAAIVAAAMAQVATLASVIAWLVALVVVTAARGFALRHAHAVRDATPPRHALGPIVASTMVSAMLWGITPWLFLGDATPHESLILLIAIAGLAAGAIPFLGCIWSLYLGYTSLIILPVAAWLFFNTGAAGLALGPMTVVYLLALAAAGRNHAANFRQTHEMAARLEQTNAEAEAANRHIRAKMDEAVRAREALARSEQRFHTAFDQAPIGMALARLDGGIFQMNPTLRDLLHYPQEPPRDLPLTDLVIDEDRRGFEATLEALADGTRTRAEVDIRLRRADGQTLWTSVAIAAVSDLPIDDRYLIVELQDITESVELSARLQYEASHDALTELTNRREFERRLNRLIAARRQADRVHSICYIDLDRFKVVNDSQGHIAGDEVLRQVAGVLHQHVRTGDTIARLGGDEFALLLENCDAPHALRIAEDLVRAIGDFRFFWDDQVFRLDLSIGVAEILPHESAVSEIMRNADTACAVAKEAGGGRAHVYRADDREMQRRHGQIEWISRITRALEHDEFELYIQPIVDLRREVPEHGMHFEVLVRMRTDDDRLLLPSSFLPAAERYGLATRIDRWVIGAVFDWFRHHPELVARIDACAINLSGTSVDDPEFAEHLVTDLRSAPLSPSQLRFEITETAAIGHLAQASRFMRRLATLGCRFALDDFGSGLSSFGYLRSLPVDTLKIDGQFVRDIARDPVDHALVRSINDIGRVLGLTTVAEYVEDRATLEALRSIDVDFVQGHFSGQPVPIDTLSGEPSNAPADA
ncbi:putative bifunctional diguanylate cyclase/phosphodiesterase [Halofilum ochraceum]|uniref:putative bifunctional diguanylate cyclase/phosphodiesterase n=1 Tax=Halofilum ochraceum TaxID=1611323 RepID=UPI001586930E|nr:EAL domain-containing protein [Halofilum ochraceum]